MKKLTLLLIIQLFGFAVLFGQNTTEPIEVTKLKRGYQYDQGDLTLTYQQMLTVVKSNEEAAKEVKSAQTNALIANCLAGAGGACIGWPLGTALGGGDPSWGMLGVGVVLVAVALPMAAGSDKKMRHAVETYNQGLTTGYYYPRPSLRLSGTQNGFGLVLRF